MKKILSLLLVALIGAGLYLWLSTPTADTFELEEGYSLLYDGKSLEGWRVIGGQATWIPGKPATS